MQQSRTLFRINDLIVTGSKKAFVKLRYIEGESYNQVKVERRAQIMQIFKNLSTFFVLLSSIQHSTC